MESSVVTVGVDLAMTASHVAVAIGGNLKGQKERTFEHTGEAIRGFVDWAVKLAGEEGNLVVALESPHGGVVEELLDRGIKVYHLNPKQLDRFREQESVCSAKDDRRDARVLAERLRTDLKCFLLVTPSVAFNVRLRELSRELGQLKHDFRAKANRLRDQLHRCQPELLKLCKGADRAWLWSVLELYPSAAKAKNASKGKLRGELDGILTKNRIRKHKVADVMDALRARSVKLAPGVAESAAGQVGRLVKALRLLSGQIKEVQALIDTELAEAQSEGQGDSAGQEAQRDAAIVVSMPGVGPTVSATLLGEAARALRDRDYPLLRALAGVAPVSRSSGKGRGRRASVSMRRACNARLRNAVHFMAQAAIRVDAAARAHYDAGRAQGQSYNRALRAVGDRLLRIMVAALKADRPYDAELLQGRYAREARAAA